MDNEYIGSIKLDYSDYDGTDHYSDGDVEDDLLDLVMNTPPEAFEDKIHEKPSWPYIYHLSGLRGNVVEWLPMDKTMSVLEIGSGCGAVTATLARKAGRVTCVELSRKRSLINAYRNKAYGNIEIKVGDFRKVAEHLTKKYDVITLIGVLEYAGNYMESPNPYRDLLKVVKRHLRPDGRVVIAIENRFGLKYFAGAKEDHTGEFFEGLEGYPGTQGIRTFSKKELENLASKAGFKNNTFFYPYPDYKLPLSIYSDKRLPASGELTSNIKNYDTEKMGLFDEGAVFDGIIENGDFRFFSNSYICILSEDDGKRDEYPIFVKYNARRPERNLRTVIGEKDGKRYVEKRPMTKAAAEQISAIKKAYYLLKDTYDENTLKINRFKETDEGLVFEYIEGKTFEKILDEVLEREGYIGVLREIKKYVQIICGIHGTIPFKLTKSFIEVFGNVDLHSESAALPAADVDMIFGNIIVGEGWNLIDYEWTFDFPVPVNYIIYRALMVYINFTPARRKLYEQGIFKDLGITEKELLAFRSMDDLFYQYALGTDNEYVSALKNTVDMKDAFSKALVTEFAKVYYDRGAGFSEADSFLTRRYEDKGGSVIEFIIPENVRSLRIDPVEKPCIISDIVALTDVGYTASFHVNGTEIGEGKWLFEKDPQIIFSGIIGRFKLSFSICHHGEDIYKVLRSTAKEKNRVASAYNELVAAINNRPGLARRAVRKLKRTLCKAVKANENKAAGAVALPATDKKYKFALVVDASHMDKERLGFTMYSLACQTYKPYDIKIFGGAYPASEVTSRINDYIKTSNADYYVFIKCGDALTKDALEVINQYAAAHGSQVIYTDSKKFNLSVGDGYPTEYKPDFAIDTLRSQNYIGSFGVFGAELLDALDGISVKCHEAYVYDLFLMSWDVKNIGHISRILHYSRFDEIRNYEEELNVLRFHGKYEKTQIPGIYKPVSEIKGHPPVSIIIPNKDGVGLLRNCIESIKRSTYSNIEVIIIENNSTTPEIFDYYEELKKKDNIQVITWDKGWNYAAINNFGAGFAKGDYLLLMNNDIEIITPEWIEEMMAFAKRGDVGAVGMKLLYPDGTIQHAGVTVGVRGVAGHAFSRAPGNFYGYMNRAVSVQDLSAVTAACMMIKKEAFEKVGGFNEGYAVAFNDVDLCLRIRKAGYKIVYTPFACGYHHESVTRGADTESEEKMRRFAGEVDRFNQDWGAFLAAGDPYYNKNLSLDDDDFNEAEYKGL